MQLPVKGLFRGGGGELLGMLKEIDTERFRKVFSKTDG
jgi:hypothetical protein